MNRLAHRRQRGVETTVLEVAAGEHGILLALKVREPAHAGHDHDHEWTVYQALQVHGQRIVDIRSCPNRYSAAVRAGVVLDPASGTLVERITPILNVSSVVDSIAWFARLGWSKTFDWRGDDGMVSFGGVTSVTNSGLLDFAPTRRVADSGGAQSAQLSSAKRRSR